MKLTELRIGNTIRNVLTGKEGGIGTITQSFNSNLSPILLTRERLIKFGFETASITDSTIYMLVKDSIKIQSCVSYNAAAWFFPDWTIIRPIKYVHQLQNLWYAITQEELYEV